jgi:hypothetical protein
MEVIIMKDDYMKYTGCNPPDALQSLCSLEPSTNICILDLDSVVKAKCWVDDNEK